jgi:hypothetical protein
MANAAKDFACEITLRFPAGLAKAQYNCAGFILAKELMPRSRKFSAQSSLIRS